MPAEKEAENSPNLKQYSSALDIIAGRSFPPRKSTPGCSTEISSNRMGFNTVVVSLRKGPSKLESICRIFWSFPGQQPYRPGRCIVATISWGRTSPCFAERRRAGLLSATWQGGICGMGNCVETWLKKATSRPKRHKAGHWAKGKPAGLRPIPERRLPQHLLVLRLCRI